MKRQAAAYICHMDNPFRPMLALLHTAFRPPPSPVRLVRPVDAPGDSGPWNGQYALQKLLRQRIHGGLDWLSIGGPLREDELPWFWCWLDRAEAVAWAAQGRPFVQGPNTLFLNSRRPRIDRLESALLDAAACRLMFTESEWYRQLIVRHRGPANLAPIVLWPYPIDPQPDGPAHAPRYDLLIYVKNGQFPGLVEQLLARYPRCCTIRYGQYRRQELWEAARHARCCCYLADDDRGPLALAEILLCGCPTVGLPTGAPFVLPGQSGILLDRLDFAQCVEAFGQCHALDRDAVASLAATQFDAQRIVGTVLDALDAARKGCHPERSERSAWLRGASDASFQSGMTARNRSWDSL